MKGLSQYDRLQLIKSLKFPTVLNNDRKSLLNKSVLVASFIKHISALNTLDETYFNEIFSNSNEGNSISDYLAENEFNGALEPSWSLLINYIENLNYISQKFNDRWSEYPYWYLNHVLGIKSLPIKGDKVWISIENSSQEPILVPVGSKFKVKREKEKTIYYHTTENAEIHNITIENIFILELEKIKNNVIQNISKTDNSFVKSINLDEYALKEDYVEKKIKRQADIGLRVSSPTLFLKEGKRTVTIVFCSRDTKCTDVINKEVSSITNAFRITISTEKGWESITDFTIQRSKENLHLDFTLPDSFSAVTACSDQLHGQNSSLPILNLFVNLNSEDYSKATLEKLLISSVKLSVSVQNISNVVVYNELGRIDNSKPFMPFGINANKGAWFILGNHEINIKDTKSIEVNFEWDHLPEDHYGLKDYYSQYKNDIDNHSFEISVKYLTDYNWKDVRGKKVFTLFKSKEGDHSLDQKNKIGKIDVEKMPIISIKENEYEYEYEYEYSLQSRDGFLHFTLVNPDMGFGEQVYRKIFTEQLMKSARKKKRFPTIQPPIQPTLNRISINYYAEEVIDLQSHPKENQSYVSSIVPLEKNRMKNEKHNENISLIPHYHDRNLIFALRNVKENTLLNLFFDVTPFEHIDLNSKSLYEQRDQIRHLEIFIGNPNRWEKAPISFIQKDETIGFLISGYIQVLFPNHISESLYDDEGLLWFRVGYNNVEDVFFPELYSIIPNAIKLEMIIPGDEETKLVMNREGGEISEETVIPGAGKITRISPFHGGRSIENPDQLLLRISEFTTHKGRAVTTKDYENLILQNFPEISTVKCITAQHHHEDLGTNIYLIVLPKNQLLEKNTYPLTPPHLIFQIESFLRSINSSYMQKTRVLNPVYEELIIRCKIELKGYFSVKSQSKLISRINELIAPWNLRNEIPCFGHSVNLENLHNLLIDEFGSLISFSDFSAIRIEKDKGTYRLSEFVYKKTGVLYQNHIITPSEVHCVFVPSSTHIMYWDSEISTSFGVNEMRIGSNFIISTNKK